MMNCKETLARFYDYLDRELSPAERREVAEHLEACRACFERMEFERLLGEFMRHDGQERVDAEALKGTVLARLQQFEGDFAPADEEPFPEHHDTADIDSVPLPEPRVGAPVVEVGRRIPIWSYVLVAAALVLVAIPFLKSRDVGTAPRDMGVLIALHTEAEPDLQNSDPEQLIGWLESQAKSDPLTREFARASCALKGMAVDSIWSHLYAETKGTPLSVFAADRATFLRPAGMVKVSVDQHDFWTQEQGGYAVVIWECPSSNVTCAAVARLEPMALVRLAEEALQIRENPGTT